MNELFGMMPAERRRSARRHQTTNWLTSSETVRYVNTAMHCNAHDTYVTLVTRSGLLSTRMHHADFKHAPNV